MIIKTFRGLINLTIAIILIVAFLDVLFILVLDSMFLVFIINIIAGIIFFIIAINPIMDDIFKEAIDE
jgi:hypothetical protein